jgi:hypothetical protein
MALYKYTKREFADLFFSAGVVRLGTLYDYRSTEQHVGGILDAEEGVGFRTRHVEDEHWTQENLPDYAQRAFGFYGSAGGGVRIKDCHFTSREQSENALIFCLSESFSQRLFDDFQADACYAIVDLGDFVRLVDASVKAQGAYQYIGAFRCVYTGRSYPHADSVIHPGVLKDQSYAHQSEIRVVWAHDSHQIDVPFLDVANPKLPLTCERIK